MGDHACDQPCRRAMPQTMVWPLGLTSAWVTASFEPVHCEKYSQTRQIGSRYRRVRLPYRLTSISVQDESAVACIAISGIPHMKIRPIGCRGSRLEGLRRGDGGSTVTESSSDPELTLKVGEPVGGDYVIVHADGTQQPPGEATPLGRGGAGDVYRAIYKHTHDRAIKFLTKRARREWPPQSERNFEWTFLRERIFLSRLSHGHIIRFYDRGTHRASDRDWEYLVTEYIDGTGDFRFELAQPDITGDECYQLITDILRALRYLHSIGISHGDVMSNNIRCRHVGGDRQAVLLDLGTALQFEDSSSSEALNIVRDLEAYAYGTKDSVGDIELAKDPWFFTTYDNTHDVIKANVFKPVARADLRRIFPYHDLYFVGKLLQDLISVPAIADKLERSLSPSGMDALKFMIDRLLRPPIEAYYKSMKDLYLDWDKLRHGYLAPADVPELSLAAEFKYSLATPAGRVVITPRLSKFVQHKLFQRLRDAPQLELLRLKYTGATHTRQEHSLLMLRNTRYYLAHLLNGPAFRFMVNKSELEATLLLSLLQGIGHYQLSHFFEDYAIEQRSNRLGAGSGIWRSVQDDIPTDRELFLAAFDWNKTCGSGVITLKSSAKPAAPVVRN